jgi:ATP-dependent DNA helicase RecG
VPARTTEVVQSGGEESLNHSIRDFSTPLRFGRNDNAEKKSVLSEYEKLSQKTFPDLRVGYLHGKLKSTEKDKIMDDFKNKKIDILVSTSVVEVGVDIPNASVMMIEGAESFGLAQLHQFRGRVGRGEHQSYCLLLSSSADKSINQRLKALVDCDDGFELAEKDLAIRGPGQFIGDKQTGIPDLAMRALNNMELVKSARAAATAVLKKDPELTSSPLLASQLKIFKKQIHLE